MREPKILLIVAFTTEASGLLQDDPAAMAWTDGKTVSQYAGLNSSFVNVALRILPVGAASPTHAALGWRKPHDHDDDTSSSSTATVAAAGTCHGGMTFSVFPLAVSDGSNNHK